MRHRNKRRASLPSNMTSITVLKPASGAGVDHVAAPPHTGFADSNDKPERNIEPRVMDCGRQQAGDGDIEIVGRSRASRECRSHVLLRILRFLSGTILYIAVSGLLTATVHYSRLNIGAPVSLAIRETGVRWGSYVVNAGALAGLSTVMLVMLLGQSRVFYSMAHDGLLWKWAGDVHPRFRTPWKSTAVTGFGAAVFGSLVPIGSLGQNGEHRYASRLRYSCGAVLICANVVRTSPGLSRLLSCRCTYPRILISLGLNGQF